MRCLIAYGPLRAVGNSFSNFKATATVAQLAKAIFGERPDLQEGHYMRSVRPALAAFPPASPKQRIGRSNAPRPISGPAQGNAAPSRIAAKASGEVIRAASSFAPPFSRRNGFRVTF